MKKLSKNQIKVLDYIQKNFPLVDRPFQQIGLELNLTEKEVKITIKQLKQEGIIRNIAGIFEAQKLGYYLSLVALEVPEEKIPLATNLINSHPGVSHNYLRDHRYNIWFTLAEESKSKFEKKVKYLVAQIGAKDFLILPSKKMLKIGVFLPLGQKSGSVKKNNNFEGKAKFYKTKKNREAVFLLQQDLPLVNYPFNALIKKKKSSLSEEKLLFLAKQLQEQKIMRRYSAVLRHHQVGYKFNAMTTWNFSEKKDSIKKLELFLKEKSITHLYLRPTFPGKWEHSLFAMIHAKSKASLTKIIKNLALKSKIEDYLVLQTLKELKKEKVIYFSDKFKDKKKFK